MADLDVGLATTTNTKNTVRDFSVDPYSLDSTGEQKKTWYDFPKAREYMGYYRTIPELKKAIDSLAIWTVGKGVETDARTKVILENIEGWGVDTFQSIMFNLLTQAKSLGDSFAEIIRNDNGRVVNLKPLFTGDMRVITDSRGLIEGYEQRTNLGKGRPISFTTDKIFHLSNDRIGNEIHGVSIVEACKWVIDARNEALIDERKIKHRDLALGVLYVDSNNISKINAATTAYEKAVKNGEVLVLPEKTAKLEDPKISPKERLQWIQYLENFFYQAVGVPRVIATSENFTEASSKVGYMTFEPIYTREQTLLEAAIWNQLALRVKFNRPPSLSGVMQESEKKNTGQTGFQPNEVTASIGRTE